mmetsp:Transcript_26152/g.39578  ORF Transcript_26152/g.39578 Transcript_26152/m.39578 type:complete len:242 (+) Transcript_26152:101-826(+)|eukprot:CAMPEP_0178906238 /NCGR_PEP_ID=MMETSP0786-20121207/6714_1 /TAXON_ID=186022 /ORGANISM="Thalassionema frauenfeldii, Strain CCMP 1798" /LENGTH=241 /DNA_ID=CAMNT_0020577923 /DNA_START=14 /DNA_END=739 /DNA_ORIENTATION=+
MVKKGLIQFVVPILLTLACIFSIAGLSYCELVRFSKADLIPKNETLVNEIISKDTLPLFPNNIGAGYWGVTRYLWVKDPLTPSYEYAVNGCFLYEVQDDVVFDSAFYAGRVFSSLTPMLAIIVCIFTCVFTAQGKTYMKCMSYMLLLTTLFSGLMLLMFSSAVCNTNNWGQLSELVEETHCQLGPGANLTITATVFYFICAVLVFIYSRSPDEDEEGEDANKVYTPGDAEAGEAADKPAEE